MKNKDRAKAIFKNARRYADASQFLFNNGLSLPNPEFFLPALVNEALALELYLKTIYYLETNKDFTVKGRFSHDFYELFKKLTPITKENLTTYFNDSLSDSRLDQIKDIKNKTNISIPCDLESNLENWSKVFVNIRYLYDNDLSGLKLSFFREIEEAALQTIYKFKPLWAKHV